ncbi:DUF4148 domain-containing protein [Achromobacter denitrificans]|nr:DUF4148 domain-containing protein [Achromobacter denitrificans]MBN3268728.1 DUF4148 domain-containing protein [Bordetella bronchiseptica]
MTAICRNGILTLLIQSHLRDDLTNVRITDMKATISSAAVAIALTVLGSSAQADTFHNANTEIGYEVHVGDSQSGKTSEQVRQELVAAKSNKREWFFTNLNAAKPGWMVPTEKTREQVAKERDSITPEERARIDEIYNTGA